VPGTLRRSPALLPSASCVNPGIEAKAIRRHRYGDDYASPCEPDRLSTLGASGAFADRSRPKFPSQSKPQAHVLRCGLSFGFFDHAGRRVAPTSVSRCHASEAVSDGGFCFLRGPVLNQGEPFMAVPIRRVRRGNRFIDERLWLDEGKSAVPRRQIPPPQSQNQPSV
jgi:hypothetical protein